ncbi:MAG TPA: response regulator [Azospirillum sp.]|nr:response regulator [Azospirillum sp.]
MKLLIVEDDPLIGPAMKAVLAKAGYTTVGPLRDAAKAMRLAQRQQPDLALVDVLLAGGEDGISLCRRLRTELGIPSLLVTGYEHHADEVRDTALGFLHKPFAPRSLLDAVGVVGEMLGGLRPSAIPRELELFPSSRQLHA